MPDYIFHMEIGDEFLSNTKKEIREILDKNYNAFLLGLQGPDLFYYRAFFPGKNKKISKIVAEGLHKEKFSQYAYLILNGMKYFQGHVKDNSEKNLLFTYFTGFFIHLFTDLFLHPYIRYKTELYKGRYRTIWLHKKFEMNLDYAYIFFKSGSFFPFFYVKKFKEIQSVSPSVSLFFSRILKEVYNLEYPVCCISSLFPESYKIMKFVLTFFEAKDFFRSSLVHPIVYFCLTGKDCVRFLTHPGKEEFEDVLNLSQSKWRHLDINEEYTFSVLELKEKLSLFLEKTISAMEKFVYKDGEYPSVFTKNYDFSKGVVYEKRESKDWVSWVF